MAKTAETKTNVMRILDQKRIPYTAHSYPHAEGQAVDGVTVASFLGMAPERVFKTLVTKGASGAYYVFDIPVEKTLDLKKAARAVGEKSVAMLPGRDLLPLTGYVHGGCSPVGMKDDRCFRRPHRRSGGAAASGVVHSAAGCCGGCRCRGINF